MAFAVAGIVVVSGSSLSQQIPGPAEPGRLEERFDQPAIPRATEKPLLPVPETPFERALPEGPQFRLRELHIEGVTVYTTAELNPLCREFLDRPASLGELQEISQRLTRKYRRDGYILSRAVVPAQRITDGTARIRVVEGYIDDIRFDPPGSTPTFGGEFLPRYAKKILESRPLKAADLERYLLLSSDLPGLNIRSVLKPSDRNVGAATLDLILAHTPLSASLSYDNRGSRFVGPEQFLASAYFNSVIWQFDQTTVRLARTRDSDELKFVEIRYSIPIGSEGLRLSFEANQSDSEPGFTLKSFNVQSASTKLATGVSYPFVRSRARNITFGSSFEAQSVNSDLLGDRLARDRLRVLRANATLDFVDRFHGISLVALEVSQGLDILDARGANEANTSREDGKANFSKISLSGQRLQALPGNATVQISLTGQYAFDPLLSTEEIGFGGASFGRAFDPSEITGDHGLAARLELYAPSTWTNSLGLPDVLQVQPYLYFDAGTVWNEKKSQDSDDGSRATLRSLGTGLRFDLTKRLSGEWELAKPLDRRPDSEGTTDWRFFFRVLARL